ncbi:hypothetical protein M427DRAFT_279351 [Gonapodya prolifera JEL478]|uniref:Uncharacterized protein n=1 Tax=Gonapodya prolifera (strain JEL478) TaxID=1344416 RepID=A0A139AYM7_GONPJ|nr:hypothetical protein M427DRAFT_279351 [Gonapodya prolifera JEL478]|eukprot:KXS21817.1 hypothetical protein M427DRAFT_279351 [Gonapodya prolifera JEL478]
MPTPSVNLPARLLRPSHPTFRSPHTLHHSTHAQSNDSYVPHRTAHRHPRRRPLRNRRSSLPPRQAWPLREQHQGIRAQPGCVIAAFVRVIIPLGDPWSDT